MKKNLGGNPSQAQIVAAQMRADASAEAGTVPSVKKQNSIPSGKHKKGGIFLPNRKAQSGD